MGRVGPSLHLSHPDACSPVGNTEIDKGRRAISHYLTEQENGLVLVQLSLLLWLACWQFLKDAIGGPPSTQSLTGELLFHFVLSQSPSKAAQLTLLLLEPFPFPLTRSYL